MKKTTRIEKLADLGDLLHRNPTVVHAAKKIIAILNGLDPLEAGAAFGRAWSIYRRHLDAVDAKKKSRPRTRASK